MVNYVPICLERVCLTSAPGECKDKMTLYLSCLRKSGSTSTPCRELSKNYLDCRMQQYVLHNTPVFLSLTQMSVAA